MKLISKTLAAAAFAAVWLATPDAHAQRWMPSGIVSAASGVEGGGGRSSSMGRAPTRMRIGADLAVDESPEDIFGAAVLLAFEPRSAFGLDGRYTRVIRERFALSGGVAAILQPGSLVGPVGAFEYRYPLGKSGSAPAAGADGAPSSRSSSTFVLTAGPEVNVFMLGTDLPDRTVLWQALFHVGIRLGF